MKLTIRTEKPEDRDIIYRVVEKAFKSAQHSDGNEHILVNKLRDSDSYIKELSLVALVDDTIVGHIMFTKAFIESNFTTNETLALAPLSISPEYQRKGIGSTLIKAGLKEATNLGYKSVIVLGSETYYPAFGFKEAITYGVFPPFEVPSENFMLLELIPESLKDVSGTVVYAKEFFQ